MNKFEKIYNILTRLLVYLFLYLTIALLWQGLEIWMLGKIVPSEVDTIICAVFTLSVYMNIRVSKTKK